MRLRMVPALFLVATSALAGCQGGSGPSQSAGMKYDPPNREFATGLGIAPPVTSDQAMAIAAEAAGGTAVAVGQETEGGELLFEVKVETSTGRKEVEVRASDGGVVEIEPDTSD